MENSHGGTANRGSSTDRIEVRALFDRYAELWTSHDAAGWMGLWDEEGVQMPPNETMNVGKEAIRRANEPLLADRSISWKFTIETQEVLPFDSGYALARGVYRLAGAPSGGAAASEMDGKFMSVLKKQRDGAWLLYRDCFNSNIPQ